MKYFLIPFIALGLTLSLIFGVEYHCEGSEMFPEFYGSPFVFIRTSLASSMEYYYSISGLVLNVLVWSGVLIILRFGIHRLIQLTSKPKILLILYKAIVGFLLLFSLLNLFWAWVTLGRGFDETSTYWYWNVDKEASDWGMKCGGEWRFSV